MRFDDRLTTVLAGPGDDASALAAAWRQIVDLLAQGGSDDAALRADALDQLRATRDSVPADLRLEIATAIAGRPLPSDLVALFASDSAVIAAPVIAAARMAASEWIALIPLLSPTARALLRHRRDLDPAVERALASYGAADLIIGAPPVAEPAAATPEPEPRQPPKIADLVARIEAFRRDHPQTAAPRAPAASAGGDSPCAAFRFETGADGLILWVDGVPRGPIIGLSVAAVVQSRDVGVDGHAAGAFRRRAPFRDARLTVGGGGPAGGEWRISGVPFFDVDSGRFLGFRGTARRPRFDERAEAPATGLYGSNMPAESLRQLVHELRTPLGAIIGFAEMIEGQILGPAAADYRERAGEILGEARRLVGAVDDLDTAARLESRSFPQDPQPIDVATLLRGLCHDVEALVAQRGIGLDVTILADQPAVAADPVSVERMFARLLSSAIGLAAPGERIALSLGPDPADRGRLRFAVGRARAIAGRDERALLDPGYSPDGDWPEAPVLGLGFALRLVRNLAEATGGRLLIEDEHFALLLPGAGGSVAEAGRTL